MIPQTEILNDENQSQTSQAAAVQVSPKPGFQSSEFAATVASAIAIGSGFVPAGYQPLVASLVGVYVACRTVLKVVHALWYAKQVPDLPSVNLQGLPK